MQNLYDEVASLDKRCYERFALSEDILMEHAANGMAEYIRTNFAKNSSVIVACGSGNNGADGLALARLLQGDCKVSVFYAKRPSSPMAKLQQTRLDALNLPVCEELKNCDILVDAIVGTGFNGNFDEKLQAILGKMNHIQAFKIACDTPSGKIFKADITLTMGALKKDLFLDEAKDFVGEIKVLDLGVSRELYEISSPWKLLDFKDLKLPHRDKNNTHKGSFGHLAVACGEKSGASILSSQAALRFGAGLVTLVGFEQIHMPYELMYSHELPKNTTALALGMGLGDAFSNEELVKFLDNALPLVTDADIFIHPIFLEILQKEKLVLTPHPKEFVAILKTTGLADISVNELQKNRFSYVELFCKTFPHATLVLKGSNVIIGQNQEFYINPHGSAILAKGGSGDVLAGLIAALLAQGYIPLDAAICGSLAHTKLACGFDGASFALIPNDLIDGIKKLF